MSHLCIKPACGESCIDCASALSPKDVNVFAIRYAWLRNRDIDAIDMGGVFAGLTPDNLLLNGADLDHAIDGALKRNNQL